MVEVIMQFYWLIMPYYSQWSIGHRPLASIQFCFVLLPPSSPSVPETSGLHFFFLQISFSRRFLVAVFCCVFVLPIVKVCSLSLCLCLYVSLSVSVCMPVCVCFCLYVSLSVSVYVYVCICLCLSVCMPVCMCLCLSLCMPVCVYLCQCRCVQIITNKTQTRRWASDDEILACQACDKVFSVTVRRVRRLPSLSAASLAAVINCNLISLWSSL